MASSVRVAEIEAERWRVPAAHLAWLEGLADAIDLEVAGEKYWVLHGGVPSRPGVETRDLVPWFAEHDPWMLRTHRHPLRNPPDLGRTVIVGHQPVLPPLLTRELIALDTGAGGFDGNGQLTALVLPERRLVAV